MIDEKICWKGVYANTIEVISFWDRKNDFQVSSSILGEDHGRIIQLSYSINLTHDWRVKSFFISSTGYCDGFNIKRTKAGWSNEGLKKREAFMSKHNIEWVDNNYVDIESPPFTSCLDIDIALTPFTNTLPIRRLNLSVGESKEISVLYVDLPEGKLSAKPRRYTRLTSTKYLFESLESKFKAELVVDKNGFVKDYPGLFIRLYAK